MARSGHAALLVVAIGIGLGIADSADAQTWEFERYGRGEARAVVTAGTASFAVECKPADSQPIIKLTYRPSRIATINLQADSLSGQGQAGDGQDTGYLFLNLDTTTVQQFVQRTGDGAAFEADLIGESTLDLLRSNSSLLITPGLFAEPAYDHFPLRGSSRAIASALEHCAASRPAQSPPSPDIAQNGGLQFHITAGEFVASANGVDCSRVIPVQVTVANAALFSTNRVELQAVVSEARWEIVSHCEAARQLRISGIVENVQVYDGVADENSGWVLVDLWLPGESAATALQPAFAGAPEPPSDHQRPDETHTEIVAAEPRPQPSEPPSNAISADGPVAIAALPSDLSFACPGVDATGYAEPSSSYSPFSSDALVYSEQDEALLLSQSLGATLYDASAGDDVIYVYDLHAGTEVWGGEGNDTIVLCSMDDASIVVMVGYESGHDTEPDTLVIEPDALLGVPAGFTREIRVFGFAQPSDRLILRLPPELGAVEITDTGSGAPKISVGEVQIVMIAPRGSGDNGRFNPAGVLVQRVDATQTTSRPASVASTGIPGAGITCPQSVDPDAYAQPLSVDHGMYRYTRADDTILVTQVTGVFSHFAGTGDDIVYVVDAGAGTHVNLDAGADTLIYCSTREVTFSVAGGDELSSIDTDQDVIIFEQGAFRTIPSGFRREYLIYSISPVNDRIVLRLPPDLDASLLNFESGFPEIRVGETSIRILPASHDPMEPVDPGMVVIERVPG